MSYNEGTTNLFYQNFKETGLPFTFVMLITVRWIVSISLHSTCNILIAANALCTAIFEPTLSIGLIIAISGINFIKVNTCFYLQFLPAFFGNLTLATMLAIGFDRVINILFASFWM
uniref:7TM_GPCR_Srx domain-containing protein n=1 Tax=Meloidogyne floridensis TaxID=298350 RepID=A0A915NU24_9BILA